MLRWLGALNAHGRHTDSDGCLFRFATAQSDRPVRLKLMLAGEDLQSDPALSIRSAPVGCRLEASELTTAGVAYVFVVEPPFDAGSDDEVFISLDGPAGVPPCRLELRRSGCLISTGLLGQEVDASTRAALLWHAHRRFHELVGLKRFETGRSGSKVMVFRPRLRAPQPSNDPALTTSGPLQVLEGARGAWLLVKTADRRAVEQEWLRFQTFLVDRLHPFLARSDAYLPVNAPHEAGTLNSEGPTPGSAEPQATLISSFLGGDLLSTETLEEALRGTHDLDQCRALIDRVVAVLAPWHAATQEAEQPLAAWDRVFGPPSDGGKLFNRFDFSQDADRRQYAAGLSWDIAFVKQEHLQHHLLGKKQPGLLPRLGEIQARFGLTHGDLTPRNVLCQSGHVWLIDFEHTGVGPVLADFARLEANLRQWCLRLVPGGENVTAAAEQFERHLLDHFQGSAGSLEPVTALAADLGAEPSDLLKAAVCITHIRRHAAAYCLEAYSDRRDYLAVLYLTLLSLLRYAGSESASPAHFRLLVSLTWLLEDALSRLVGLQPYNRGNAPLSPPQLLAREWLAPPEAPARLRYLMEREDGRRALAPLAATRGVWQNPHHHLDVYDHTVLVLAYLEAILSDPVAALLDPAALDRRVAEDLRRQNIALLPIPASSVDPPAPARAEVRALAGPVADLLKKTIGPDEQLLLKWLAVLHDVGKPATRSLHDGKVQFLGHELYSLQMVHEHLAHLYPEDDLRRRLETLIRKHHVPHQLVSRFIDHPADFDALVRGLASGHVPAGIRAGLEKYARPGREEFLPDFVGIMLHGYADRLAGRGKPIGPTAEVVLAILGFCTQEAQPRPKREEKVHD